MASLWQQDSPPVPRPPLSGDLTRTCTVIGGGLTGVLTAYLLRAAGVDAAVLEAREVGGGQTGCTAAKVTAQHGVLYRRLIRQFGRELAAQYAHANLRGVEDLKALVRDLGIDCGLRERDTVLYSRQDGDELRLETQAARSLGLPVRFTAETELPFPVAGASVMAGQATLHPLRLLRALARELEVYEHTPVLRVEGRRVVTPGGTVTARHVVFACRYPFPKFPGLYFLRLHQTRSYLLALRDAARLERCYLGVDPGGLSFRPQGDLLLLGGGGHRAGQCPGDSFAALRRAARRLYPGSTVLCRWSAQDCVSLDGVPYIGPFSPTRPYWYVAAGFGKWGMSSAMAAGRILTGDITGRPDPDRAVFSPRRCKPLASAPAFGADLAVAAAGLVRSALPRKKHDGPFPTPPRCPHMGCQLTWNREEKTWECPCHGSRFDREGRLLDGPAQTGLV